MDSALKRGGRDRERAWEEQGCSPSRMAEEEDGMKLVEFFETLKIRQNKTWEPLNLDTSCSVS